MFPVLADLEREHIADYDEILPHVFMADVSRYILSGADGSREIVGFLDKSMRGRGAEIRNVIAVSFVENLESYDDFERALGGQKRVLCAKSGCGSTVTIRGRGAREIIP